MARRFLPLIMLLGAGLLPSVIQADDCGGSGYSHSSAGWICSPVSSRRSSSGRCRVTIARAATTMVSRASTRSSPKRTAAW